MLSEDGLYLLREIAKRSQKYQELVDRSETPKDDAEAYVKDLLLWVAEEYLELFRYIFKEAEANEVANAVKKRLMVSASALGHCQAWGDSRATNPYPPGSYEHQGWEHGARRAIEVKTRFSGIKKLEEEL